MPSDDDHRDRRGTGVPEGDRRGLCPASGRPRVVDQQDRRTFREHSGSPVPVWMHLPIVDVVGDAKCEQPLESILRLADDRPGDARERVLAVP